MNNNEVELLLVEDDPNDVELTLIALRKHKLANKIHVVRDGEEALDFLFARGAYAQRTTQRPAQGHPARPETAQGQRPGSVEGDQETTPAPGRCRWW